MHERVKGETEKDVLLVIPRSTDDLAVLSGIGRGGGELLDPSGAVDAGEWTLGDGVGLDGISLVFTCPAY